MENCLLFESKRGTPIPVISLFKQTGEMFVLLFLILAVVVSAQTRLFAAFPTSGRTTCNDQTPRKDEWAGRYVNGPLNGVTFPANHNVPTVTDCFNLCAGETDCAAFTYYSGPCNLFLTHASYCTKMEGGGTGTWNGVFTALSVNGYLTCADSTCRKDLWAGQWVNCAGTAFGQTQVADEKGCASQCLATAGCTYFTFYPGGACNLFVPPGGICTQGPSGAQGSWYRYGSSTTVNTLEGADTSLSRPRSPIADHDSLITGLAVGLGVAGFLVLALSGVVITLLVKWGKRSASEEENSVQLM